MKEKVAKYSILQYPVLILGETGTGKELIARALHGRRTGKFLGLNCGGFPEHLVESELFGHVAGAFTGAVKDKIGLFEAAYEGTIFLDEVGDLPLHMQVKLLRVLQEKTIRRVGGNEEIRVSCKVVSATQPEKLESIRKDLFFRISTLVVELKPLRERRCDIEPIARSLGYNGDVGWLAERNLEGNVREIEQQVIRKMYA